MREKVVLSDVWGPESLKGHWGYWEWKGGD